MPPGIDEPVFTEPWQAEAFARTRLAQSHGLLFGTAALDAQDVATLNERALPAA